MNIAISLARPIPALIAAAFIALLACAQAPAQSDVENAITYYGEDNIRGFIQPLADLYGADINSGFYHSAAIPAEGFHFNIDFTGAGSIVSDDDKIFSAKLPAGFTETNSDQPTILGPRASLFTDGSGAQYKGSDGMIDASLFSYGVGQVTFGTVQGTEAFIRFLASPELGSGKFPKTTLFGGGIRHSISQYLVEPPLDIAVGIMYNTMAIGDIMDITGIVVGAQGSKTWDTFTFYGGAGWEKSTLKLDYTSAGATPAPVNIELDGKNTFRVTAGGLLKFGVFKLFADANIGSVVNFSGGIGFGN
ncbi:MAG TPA: DUF6588 family protein [Bacteroidota bacterium]|nr:DUF6588 family protein [Bacteroidota bacterium]